MTALELHRKHASLDLAPILRVIKYMGFESNALSSQEVELILELYPDFERDPEVVVGIEAVCRLTELEADRVTEILAKHRHQIPYLGTSGHPMVPAVGIGMIRALASGADPLAVADKKLYTLTEMAERTRISLASLSKYVREQPDRIPSRLVGKMRKYPAEADAVFRQIKTENMGRRASTKDQARRQRAAVSKRYAAKFADLEEQVETALQVSDELSRTLKRLVRQIRRARTAAESGSRAGRASGPGRARRSGGHRPDTIVAACKRVLADADGPMRVADITERVIALGTPIRAKNPNVTISSILSSYDDFGRVKRGYYELLRHAEPSRQRVEPDAPATTAADAVADDVAERDPGDVLAGLRAAAAGADDRSGEQDRAAGKPAVADRGDDRVGDDEDISGVGLEPFGATG